MKNLTDGRQIMNIRTWQERWGTLGIPKNTAMQAEIDELRAALAERDAEIERLNKGWGAANLLAFKHAQSIEAQRKVLEQAKEALRGSAGFDERNNAIEAIQGVLK